MSSSAQCRPCVGRRGDRTRSRASRQDRRRKPTLRIARGERRAAPPRSGEGPDGGSAIRLASGRGTECRVRRRSDSDERRFRPDSRAAAEKSQQDQKEASAETAAGGASAYGRKLAKVAIGRAPDSRVAVEARGKADIFERV